MPLKKRTSTDLIVVHNAATSPSMDIGAADIDRWHRARGWLGIGYHWVIRRNGVLEPGRDMDSIGAHARGYNSRSVAICMAGGIAERPANDRDSKAVQKRGFVPLTKRHEMNFTENQFITLWDTIIMLRQHYPEASVVGHCELDSNKPDCPGFNLERYRVDHGLLN